MKELLDSDSGRRSVILATNALQHLSHPRVNKIVVIRDGRIAEQGTYSELASNEESIFSRFLAVLDETGMAPHIAQLEQMDDTKVEKKTRMEKTPDHAGGTNEPRMVKKNAAPSKLMTVEERSTGHVDLAVYFTWAEAAGGIWLPLVLVLAYGLVECIQVASKWWLTYWSEHGQEGSQLYFLIIYAVSTCFEAGFSFLFCKDACPNTTCFLDHRRSMPLQLLQFF